MEDDLTIFEKEYEEDRNHRFDVPCCPSLDPDDACDVLDFHYRLLHHVTVIANDRPQRVTVEVLIHASLERCSGPTTLGDLMYTTTLLPGEKVRLFTMDRRTRFSFDSASKVSYRREQTSEEKYYMSSMSDFMSDVTVRDEARSANQRRGSFETHGETSGVLGTIFGSPSVDVNGSYSAESSSAFLRELSQHTQASHNRSVQATRTASSVSVGEVQSRTHAEGETEDHFESASRVFSNPNRCHAVTYLFYQINKTQTVKFSIKAIQRRVIDPAANTRITNNNFVSRGEVGVIPTAVLATDANRLVVEENARASVTAQTNEAARFSTAPTRGFTTATAAFLPGAFVNVQDVEPLSAQVQREALDTVDDNLVRVGILDKATGTVSEETVKTFSFETQTSLPTPGLLVRGCLDKCNVCEPTLRREITLDLQRKKLENELLKRKIELLDQSQEYRCCPEEGYPDEDSADA